MSSANARATASLSAAGLVLACLCGLSATPALAQLEGDAITCSMGFPPGSLYIAPGPSAVVGPGVEFTLHQPSTPLFTFDFTYNSLTITAVALNAIGVSSPMVFSSVDWPANPSAFIAGLYIQPGSAVITPAGLSYTAHSFTVNLCCGTWRPGDTATIDIYSDSELVADSEQSWGSLKAQYR